MSAHSAPGAGRRALFGVGGLHEAAALDVILEDDIIDVVAVAARQRLRRTAGWWDKETSEPLVATTETA